MKKLFAGFLALALCESPLALAETEAQYPNTSGQVLFELKTDRAITTTKNGAPSSNTYVNIEPDLSLNLDKNWSIKTGWRIFPTMQNREGPTPERSRTILSADRGFNQDHTTLIVEELKAHYENDDMRFFAGKFNPSFATMYRKTKRVGVFVTDFTEDYELREKVGGGISALLEDSEITFNTFFNDPTGLSGSYPNNRGRERSNNGLAGNTSTLSSYTATIEGQKIFGVENLFYNVGYRSLGVANDGSNARETGYTINLEYLKKITHNTSLIPLIEFVKINNFTGHTGRNAQYVTMALIGKYSSWSASIASVKRNVENNYQGRNSNDSQFQFTASYKFTNNFAIDVSRMRLKEDSYSGSMIGIMLSYLYKF